MSTTSPVTSSEAAASFPCSCSCATASGEIAKAATKVAATANFETVDLSDIELNMPKCRPLRVSVNQSRLSFQTCSTRQNKISAITHYPCPSIKSANCSKKYEAS